MRRAPLRAHLSTGSFSLRAADKAGVTRTRTLAKDLVTVSRGIRVPVDSVASGAAALRAYTELDDESVLAMGSAAQLWGTPLPRRLEEDWRIRLSRRRGSSPPRRVNVVGHLLTLLPDEVVELDGVRLTSPARTWLDLARVLGVDELVAAGDALVCEHGPEFPVPREALCGIDELRAMVARHPGSRGVRKARTAVEPLQYEGVHHNGDEQYLRDIRRADIAARLGWLELRLSRLDLSGVNPPAVSKVRVALQARREGHGGAVAPSVAEQPRPLLQGRVRRNTARGQEWLGWFLAEEVHFRVNPASRRNSL